MSPTWEKLWFETPLAVREAWAESLVPKMTEEEKERSFREFLKSQKPPAL